MKQPYLTGVILAGGKARRMGGCDKGLVMLNGKYLYQWVLERLEKQVKYLQINANRNQSIYEKSGYPVINDTVTDYPGPLAGILAGLASASTEWVVFVPCDTPLIPDDLVLRLWQQKAGKYIAFAADEIQDHPTLCLIHKNQIEPLKAFLNEGNRKLMLFFAQQHAQQVSFIGNKKAFDNLNTQLDCDNWLKKEISN